MSATSPLSEAGGVGNAITAIVRTAETRRQIDALDTDTAAVRLWRGKRTQARKEEEEEKEKEEQGEWLFASHQSCWTVYRSYILYLLQSHGKTNNIWRKTTDNSAGLILLLYDPDRDDYLVMQEHDLEMDSSCRKRHAY